MTGATGPAAAVVLVGALLTAVAGPAHAASPAFLSGPANEIGPRPVTETSARPAESGPRPAVHIGLRPAAEIGPPGPPPVRSDPPAGVRPGRAAGLRVPVRCDPVPADPSPATDRAAGDERLQLDAVHRLATGRGQLVAVIDTGVFPHERFGDRLRGGGDYLTGADGLDDCDGHGTEVAGILAASDPDPAGTGPAPAARVGVGEASRNEGGAVGIAPGARLLAIRQSSPSYEVADTDGSVRPAGDTQTLAEAVVLAVREGATVVNISEAVCLPPDQAASAGEALHAALRFATDSDVVVVAAAGNVGVGGCVDPATEPAAQVSLPGWYGDTILTVGAVDPLDAPAPFTVPGPWVDVAAPGTGLRSLAVGGGTTGSGIDGTSFAAPWVAGLAALVRERFPQLRAAQVVDRILATARRPGGGDTIGHGVVDPVAALTALPGVLRPAAASGAAPSVDLAGTTPARPPAPAPWPLDLLAAAAALVACAAAALVLRRTPRRRASRSG